MNSNDEFDTYWAHTTTLNFIRTLQILDVIKSEYEEQFYLLFFTILSNFEDYNIESSIITMYYLLNYLKNNYKQQIFEINFNSIKCNSYKCNSYKCEHNDKPILNMNDKDKEQIIKDFEYLFENNLLFIFYYDYKINEDGINNPSKSIKLMLDNKLEPCVIINFNKYLFLNIDNQTTNFPTLDKIKHMDNECIDNYLYVVNLIRWTTEGIEFKKSYDLNSGNKGIFSVPELKYVSCNPISINEELNIFFYSLMFDYNRLNNDFKKRVNNKKCKYSDLIDPSLQIIEDNNYDFYFDKNNNFINGYTTITTPIGLYIGDLINGQMNGNVSIKYNNGDEYCGTCKNNLIDGYGIMKYEYGDIYEGEWKNNKQNGTGIMKNYFGDIYKGEWKENSKNGTGTMKYINGDIYKGEWKENSTNGNGTMKYKNGDIYEGEWKNSSKNGIGTMKYKNGDIYKGEWKYGLKEGTGTIYYKNLNKTYKSEWYYDNIIKPNEIKSVIIKEQGRYGTCWAHATSRNFIRTLQILDVIKSEYKEQFYLLFFSILTEFEDCNEGGYARTSMNYLLNYLKDNYKEKIFKIKYNSIKCYSFECEHNDKPILNMDNTYKEQLIKDFEYLFENNLLFIFYYFYKINKDSVNYPSKSIKLMLDNKLQPYVVIYVNNYLNNNIKNKTTKFPTVDKIEYMDNNCKPVNPGHAVNLRRWITEGIEFKNSYGFNSGNKGNFSVPDLKYVSCEIRNKEKDILFYTIMFDYNRLNNDFKKRVNNKKCKYFNLIDPFLKIIEDNSDFYFDKNNNFINGYASIINLSGKYTGNIINGQRNGYGKMKYHTGYIYVGEWKNNERNGTGEMRYPYGDIYDGEWKNNEINGNGKMIYHTGYIYVGKWKNNKRNGYGTMKYPDGTIYKGKWKNNKKKWYWYNKR